MPFKKLTGDISLDSGEVLKGSFTKAPKDITLDEPKEIEKEPDTLMDRLSERATNTWEYMKRQFAESREEPSVLEIGPYQPADTSTASLLWDYTKEVPIDTIMSLGVGLGQIVGGLEDIAFTGLGKLAKAITPEEAQDWIYDRFLDFSSTEAGQLGIKALGKGIDAWDEFEEKHPDTAMELGSMLNLMGAEWAGKLATKFGKRPVSEILRAGSDVVHELGKISPQHVRNKIKQATDTHFFKAIKPAVGIGLTAENTRKFKESAANAVESIVANKNKLKLTDDLDMPVDNALPKTLKQFNEAISQRKQHLFKQYDDIARVAGDKGLTIDVSDLFVDKLDESGNLIQAPLNAIMRSEGMRLMDKNVVDRASELIEILDSLPNGRMSVYEAQKAIQAANNLKSKVPGLDNQVADFLRAKLDTTIDNLVDSRYSNIKKEYGHLKAIENSVSKAAFSELKKGSGFFDVGTSIFSLGEIAKGLAGGGVKNIAKGLTEKAVQQVYKRLNKPDRRITKMFEEADKAYKRMNIPDPGMALIKMKQADKIYADAVNSNIDNEIKQLEGQRVIPFTERPRLTEGAIRLPGPSPKPLPETLPLPAKLSEFKNLKLARKTEDGKYRWVDKLSGKGFETKTDNPAEVRKALRKIRQENKKS